jgi:hypothetical protein
LALGLAVKTLRSSLPQLAIRNPRFSQQRADTCSFLGEELEKKHGVVREPEQLVGPLAWRAPLSCDDVGANPDLSAEWRPRKTAPRPASTPGETTRAAEALMSSEAIEVTVTLRSTRCLRPPEADSWNARTRRAAPDICN